MTKLNSEIVDNLISDEKLKKLLDVFKVNEVNVFDIKGKQYDSSTIYGKDELTGRAFKRFFRYTGSCFDDVKQEILSNPNSSYVTFFNRVAKEDGLVPEWMSVLTKQSDVFRAQKEVIASQLFNYCGVPTCANFSMYDNKKRYERNLVSIDMISENERFYTTDDFKFKYKYDYDLEMWHKQMIALLDKQKIIKKHPEKKDKIITDLVYSYLIRRVLLGDSDCQPWNIGMLINEKDEYIKLVNFDFEYCFRSARLLYGIDQDLNFAKKHFPNEYKRFLEIVKEVKNVLPMLKDLEDETIRAALNKNVDYIEMLDKALYFM